MLQSNYVLAHSAAGGYLVRYLLLGPARRALLQSIHAIAFTDSTHRIQWCREDPELFEFLQSPSCLYIRNNTARSSFGKDDNTAAAVGRPGDEAEVDHWWRLRFGNLRIVWAGTREHSRVCWVAREVIWQFFDENTSS